VKHRSAVRDASRRAGVIAAAATAAAAVTGMLVLAAAVVLVVAHLPASLDFRLVAAGVGVVLLAVTVAAQRPLRALHRVVERWAVHRGAAAVIRHLDSIDPATAGDEVERYITAALARQDVNTVVGLLTVMRHYQPDRAAGLAAAMVLHVLADEAADEAKGDAGVRPTGR
jgi:hypothetical protein